MKLSHKRRPALRTATLLLACAAFSVSALTAQERTVHISRPNITIGDALREIEAQTGMSIAVNLGKLNVSDKVQLTRTQGSARNILDQLLAGTGMTYILQEGRILIIPPKGGEMYAVVPARQVAPRNDNSEFERAVSEYNRLQAESQVQQPQPATPGPIAVPVREPVAQEGRFTYPSQIRQVAPGAKYPSSPYSHTYPRSFALKTNLLWGGATFTPNLGFEVGLGRKTSLELMAGYNPWNLKGSDADNEKLVHTVVKPEFRYWLCERLGGHFFGLHALYANYNVSGHDLPLLGFEKPYRYEGTAWGGGVSYGYHWVLNRHWGLEFNVGVGVAYMKYDQYDCEKCGRIVDNRTKWYYGPTNAGIKLVYTIK